MEDITEEKLEFWGYVEQAFAGETASGWIRKPCPRCEDIDGKPDYKESLGYNSATGGFNCFKCGMKGSLPRNRRERLELLEPEERRVPEGQIEVEPAVGYIPIFDGVGATASIFEAARSYILRPKTDKGRGLAFDTARGMGIGAALSGPLSGRVIVPIPNYLDPSKSWRGWIARDYTGSNPMPYRYPKGMSREGLLWNEATLWRETEEPAFICEGAFDAAPFWPDGVACLGKPIQSHLPLFLAARRPLLVLLDGDAWEEGWALAMTLRHYERRAGNIRLPPRTDPDEVPREWLIQKAIEALT